MLGLPFRDAHHIAGAAVKRAEELGVDLPDLPLAELQTIEPRDHRRRLSRALPAASAASRTSYGGTAPEQVRRQIAAWKETSGMTRALAVHAALAALAALALAGCGKQGELEPPRAIAGQPAPAPTGWVADRDAAAARARADAAPTVGPQAPQSVEEVGAIRSLPAPRDPPLVPPDGPSTATPAPTSAP